MDSSWTFKTGTGSRSLRLHAAKPPKLEIRHDEEKEMQVWHSFEVADCCWEGLQASFFSFQDYTDADNGSQYLWYTEIGPQEGL